MRATQPVSRPSPLDGRCEHCGLPFPKPPVTETIDGTKRVFCSKMCREAHQDHHPESPVYHGLERVQTGVSGLDAQLPEELSRNAFVLIMNSPGARWGALSAELVWRTHVCGGDLRDVPLCLEEVNVSLFGEQLDGKVTVSDDTDRLVVLDDDDASDGAFKMVSAISLMVASGPAETTSSLESVSICIGRSDRFDPME